MIDLITEAYLLLPYLPSRRKYKIMSVAIRYCQGDRSALYKIIHEILVYWHAQIILPIDEAIDIYEGHPIFGHLDKVCDIIGSNNQYTETIVLLESINDWCSYESPLAISFDKEGFLMCMSHKTGKAYLNEYEKLI